MHPGVLVKPINPLYSRVGNPGFGNSYWCVGKLSNPVSAAHPVFASAEAEYDYRSACVCGGRCRIRTYVIHLVRMATKPLIPTAHFVYLSLVVGEGFEPSLTANLAYRGYKSRRATVTLPYQYYSFVLFVRMVNAALIILKGITASNHQKL